MTSSDLVVQVNNMQYVQELPLVLVNTLDLYIEERIERKVYSAFFFDQRSQFSLVASFGGLPLAVKFLVVTVSVFFQLFYL